MQRGSVTSVALLALLAAPPLVVAAAGPGFVAFASDAAAGLSGAVGAVGWVLVPQLLLALAVLSLALEQLVRRAAGAARPQTPGWLDPAVESALLLGLLGTISGMVSGFVGVTPDELEPGPLVHSLGIALRSSFVGFLIALVGVWAKARPIARAGESGAVAA